MSFASPTGGVVNAGSATITQNGSVTNINQSTQRASINWQNFSIASNETVNFNQPNSSAVTLNRVVGNERSVIDGALNANGQVWILNSNGVLFGKDASINTAGLVASTMNMSDAAFMNGSTTFESTGSSASVINTGTIRVTDGGYVALLGKEVANEGLIQATKGTVALAAGDKITLNFNGDSLVGIAIDAGTLNALVENKGAIIADGGKIFLTTKAAADLLNGVVNNTGLLQANSLDDVTGTVVLDSNTLEVDGTIKAGEIYAGNQNVSKTTIKSTALLEGDFVETSAHKIVFEDGMHIKAKDWLIDPYDVYLVNYGDTVSVGDNAASADTTTINVNRIMEALDSGNVTISTGTGGTQAGNITVNSDIYHSSANTLTLSAYNNIYINSLIEVSGTGTLVLNYYQGTPSTFTPETNTYSFGNDTEPGSSTFKGRIDLAGTSHFQTKLGDGGTPIDWTIITSLGAQGDELTGANTLQGIAHSSKFAGNYVLGSDIIAMDTQFWNEMSGFKPIGDMEMAFTGRFDGLGHKIDGLFIDRPIESYIGLFGQNSGTIRNVAIAGRSRISGSEVVGGLAGKNNGFIRNAHIVESTIRAGGDDIVGGLVGYNTNLIQDSYASNVRVGGLGMVGGLVGSDFGGSITDSFVLAGEVRGDGDSVGGLAGHLQWGPIADSYVYNTTVTVADLNDYGYFDVGGLVGYMYGGTIVRSAAKGVTVNAQAENVGGLVGSIGDSGSITDSYATGSVDGNLNVGGLVGNLASGTINKTYSTAAVTGVGNLGGLVGVSSAPDSISNSFWDTETSGQATSAGGTGKTTAQMNDIATFEAAGWDIATQDSTYLYPSLTMGGTTVWTIPVSSVSLSYTLSDILSGYTYNGTSTLLSTLWSASTIFGADYSSWVAGTDYNFVYGGNTVTGFANAGTYSNITVDIIKSGFNEAAAGNSAGSFVIAPKAVTITGTTANTKVYDGTTTATLSDIGSISTGIEGELLTLNAPSSSVFATKNAGTAKTVTASGYTLSDGAGGLASNYTLNADSVTTTADITPKGITVTATAESKVYDGTTAATATLASAGIIEGDTVTLSGTATFDTKNAELEKAVTVASLTKSGTDSENYTISNETATATADITAKAITVTATAENKVYDGTPDATATLASSDIIEGDSVTLSGTATFDDENIGEGKTVTVASLSKSGTDAANYTIANESATATADITEPVIIAPESDTEDVITAIVNSETVHVEVPEHVEVRVEAPRTITYREGREISLVSAPVEGQSVQKISMEEVTALQKPAQSSDTASSASAVQETRVALYQDSVVDLVNGGVSLPEGVHQEFYVVKNDAPSNTTTEKEAN